MVAAPDSEPILPPDVRIVRDRVAFEGPLTGLLAGLLEARAPLVMVVGGDMPTLVGDVLAAMLAELDGHGRVDAVVLQSNGQARPLPMALRREPALIATASLLDAGAAPASARSPRRSTAASSSRRPWRALDPDGRTLGRHRRARRPGLTGAHAPDTRRPPSEETEVVVRSREERGLWEVSPRTG